MTKAEVLSLLQEKSDPRGIKHWARLGSETGWTSYGVSLTVLRKLAKQIGGSHELAVQLWSEPNFECKLMAILLEEPKRVTQEQVEQQCGDLGFWMLSHTYCSDLLSRLDFRVEKTVEWARSADPVRRRCAFLCLYHLAKEMKRFEDSFFEPYLEMIEKDLQSEENFVRDAMNSSLLQIGQRSLSLNRRCIDIARAIGPVQVDYGDNSCQPTNVILHLTGDRIQKKLRS